MTQKNTKQVPQDNRGNKEAQSRRNPENKSLDYYNLVSAFMDEACHYMSQSLSIDAQTDDDDC